MRRPSFQFYPADWRNNANLRRCSPAARGVWVDVMCVLHDSDEYGIVRWPLIDLANSANAPIKLVRELVEKSVLKGHDKRLEAAFIYVPRSGRKNGPPVILVDIQDGPVWFSSRMVKDEYVRTIRGESTRFGEAPIEAPKPPFGDGSTSSSTSSPTGKKDKTPRKRDSAPEVSRPEEVAEQTWADWLQLRKGKRAAVSNTVLNEARLEADKAGVTLDRFLSIWCIRGSQGLQAEWIKPHERGQSAPQGRYAAAAAGIFPTQDQREVIDV